VASCFEYFPGHGFVAAQRRGRALRLALRRDIYVGESDDEAGSVVEASSPRVCLPSWRSHVPISRDFGEDAPQPAMALIVLRALRPDLGQAISGHAQRKSQFSQAKRLHVWPDHVFRDGER